MPLPTLILLLLCSTAAGQLYISPGAQLQLSGNAQFTLRDINLVNNGTFFTGNGNVLFSGRSATTIGGNTPVYFFILHIDKEEGQSLLMEQSSTVINEARLSRGYLDLNGHDLNLGSTGIITGETETSRIIGANGGEVIATATLNAPYEANPGNLGAVISSANNPGNLTIKRGHLAQNLEHGSIRRYYTITASNNTALNATLRFHYYDAELNGLNENELAQWRSEDGNSWSYIGFGIRNTEQNYVEKNGIEAFSIWTLSTASAALPVVFSHFNLQCNDGKVIFRWKTAQEINSSHFIIERSNGTSWTAIGKLPAAGNSSTEKDYEYIDHHPLSSANYRIAQYDLDGQIKYTNTMAADCDAAEAMLAWPNPFQQAFSIRLQNNNTGPARLRVVDARGASIINKQLNLQRGLNQFDINLASAAAGIYLLSIEWTDGKPMKTIRLIKK